MYGQRGRTRWVGGAVWLLVWLCAATLPHSLASFPGRGLELEADFYDEEFEQEFTQEASPSPSPSSSPSPSGAASASPARQRREAGQEGGDLSRLSGEATKDAAPLDTHDLDEEEFVGLVPSEPAREATSKQDGTGELSKVLSPQRGYYVEGLYVLLLALYCANFFYGRNVNRNIATAWARGFGDLFRKNFSKVGDGAMLAQESHSVFKMTATGRRNCAGLQATLSLKRRHDVLSLLVGLFYPVEDTLTIEVPMEADGMDPFIFAIIAKNEVKQVQKENPDLTTFAREIDDSPDEATVLTDTEEIVAPFLYEHVTATISKYRHLFRYLHFTDQAPYENHKKLLRFVYRLPPPDKMEEMTTLLRMALHFIDLVARTKLSLPTKNRAEKRRTRAAEEALRTSHTQRQEAAQQRKLEKKQKEQQRLASLSKDQQRKLEEREQKRQRKKRMPKFKVVYG